MTPRHLLIVQIWRMMLGRKFPQPIIFLVRRFAALDFDSFSFDFERGARLFLQIQIPIRILILSPIRGDDQILAFKIEIRNRDDALLSRFASGGMQKQNRLRAKIASNSSAAEVEEEGVDGHEPLDEEIVHLINPCQNFWKTLSVPLSPFIKQKKPLSFIIFIECPFVISSSALRYFELFELPASLFSS